MLLAWTYVLDKETSDSIPEIQFLVVKCATQIFNTYIECHLAAPDGCRQPELNLSEILDDYEETDRVRFEHHLQVIGICGRTVPSYSLPLLYR